MKILIVVGIIGAALAVRLHHDANPPELGKVPWLRNYEKAVKLAKKENKPIMLLFQEVPG